LSDLSEDISNMFTFDLYENKILRKKK